MNDDQENLKNGYPLSDMLLKSTHEKLMSVGRGANKSPGSYKTEQNYLVDRNGRNVMFVPISPTHIQSGMDELFSFINGGSEESLICTALAHIEFEALHPFNDGNGRIGRMLIPLMLWKYKIISEPYF